MSRSPGKLFIGRLNKDVRTRELEDLFEVYGKVVRCEIKYGAEFAYAFVDFEDKRDAEDALDGANRKEFLGERIVVEWAKGERRDGSYNRGYGGGGGGGGGYNRSGGYGRGGYDRYGGGDYNRGYGGGGGGYGRRECYKCGSSRHMARDCPRRSRSLSRERDRSYRDRSRSRSRSDGGNRERSRSRSHSRSDGGDDKRSRSRSGSRP